MPRFPDKVIINENRDQGGNFAISKELDSLRMLGDEIMELRVVTETDVFRDEMAALCKPYNKAQGVYLAGLRELVTRVAAFVDSKVV